MAATTGVFTTTPTAGVNFYDLSSTQHFAPLTGVAGSDGVKHIYGKFIAGLGSIATCNVGTAGSITAASAGAAAYIMNIPGGSATGQYGWVKNRTI